MAVLDARSLTCHISLLDRLSFFFPPCTGRRARGGHEGNIPSWVTDLQEIQGRSVAGLAGQSWVERESTMGSEVSNETCLPFVGAPSQHAATCMVHLSGRTSRVRQKSSNLAEKIAATEQ